MTQKRLTKAELAKIARILKIPKVARLEGYVQLEDGALLVWGKPEPREKFVVT